MLGIDHALLVAAICHWPRGDQLAMKAVQPQQITVVLEILQILITQCDTYLDDSYGDLSFNMACV